MKKKILLNRMYCGNYLNTDGNIGHEVINLFKDDNGNNYIYIMSDGTIAMNHNDSIKTILLVRWIGNHLIEILAKAEDLKQIIYKNIKGRSDREKIHNEQIKYIKENNITYGNIRVDKLFKGNIYQGGDDETIALYATFITKKLRKPKQAIYITDKKISNEPNNTFLLEGKNFSRQSPKMYYEEGTISYETLEKIINTDE